MNKQQKQLWVEVWMQQEGEGVGDDLQKCNVIEWTRKAKDKKARRAVVFQALGCDNLLLLYNNISKYCENKNKCIIP